MTAPAATPSRVSAHHLGLVLVSIASVQFGAGFAGRLFDEVGPAGVVMMRQGLAALALVAVSRPWRRRRAPAEWRSIVAFGVVLAGMNLSFYEAVNRLPLGVAVTVELLGPLGLAVALSRRATEYLWVALAVAGVLLLGEGDISLPFTGMVFALLAALGWASYIVLSRKTGEHSPGIDGLALAMCVATLVAAPLALGSGTALLDPSVLGRGALVALLSGLVPFSLDVLALRHVPQRVFGVLMSLSPAAATLSGFVLLDQRLGAVQLLAVVMVIVASAATVLGGGG